MEDADAVIDIEIGMGAECDLEDPGSAYPARSDLMGIDVQLGELTDDGEPGHAHVPILSGSLLVDAGGEVFVARGARDQVGERRNDGDGDDRVACDIGAVEFRWWEGR